MAAVREHNAEALEGLYRAAKRPAMAALWEEFRDLAFEHEAIYNEAWAGLVRRMNDGKDVPLAIGYVVSAARNAATDVTRQPEFRKRAAGDPEELMAGTSSAGATPEQRVEAKEKMVRAAIAHQGLEADDRAVLSRRWQGKRPAEIQAELGLSAHQYKRRVRRAKRAALARWEELEGEGMARTTRAMAEAERRGILDGRRRELARKLLRHSPLMGAQARRLRELEQASRRAAAAGLIPVAPLAAGGGASERLAQQLAQSFAALREGVVTTTRWIRQHVLQLLGQAPAADTAASQVTLSGAFRGSGAALASCVLATGLIGGGSAVCVKQGVLGDVRNLIAGSEPRPPEGKPDEEAPETLPPAVVESGPAPGPQKPAGQTPSQAQAQKEAQDEATQSTFDNLSTDQGGGSSTGGGGGASQPAPSGGGGSSDAFGGLD